MRVKQKSNSVNLTNHPGCLLGFGLFWVAFSTVFVVIGLKDENVPFAIFGGLFVLIGVGMVGYGLLSLYTRARIGKPDVNVSSKMLCVGEPFSLSYVHTFQQAVRVDEIVVQLVFKETAVYQRGTDTKTVTHEEIVAEFREPGRHFQAGNLLSNAYSLQIPPDGMHSLDVRRNKLEWFLRLRMSVPRLPDFVEQIPLTVRPELVP